MEDLPLSDACGVRRMNTEKTVISDAKRLCNKIRQRAVIVT
jgi:hypothetical protein